VNANPEIGMLALLWSTTFIVAAFAYRRRHDPFDPGVFVPIIYSYLTTGPCIFKILMGLDYHPGLKVQMLQPVLLSCTSAVIGYSIGCAFALRGIRRIDLRQATGQIASVVHGLGNRWSTSLLRGMSMTGCMVTLAIFAWTAIEIQSEHNTAGASKSVILASVDSSTLSRLHFSAAATTLLLTFFVITDAYDSKTAFSWPVVLLIGGDFLVCATAGERDFMLVAIVWFTVNWKRLPKSLAVLAIGFFVFWLGISPVIRASGLGLWNQVDALGDVQFEEWFQCVTTISGNLHVYTNVMYEVPLIEEHWHGRSLIGTALSFLPGESALAEATPARWFKEIYDWQRVAGFAFSQDAEAYLNFGWVGPPVWFAVWGWMMGMFYRRATQPAAHLSDVFIWWHATAVSLFAIRSDSRTPAKMMVFGIVASKLICYVADLWGASQSRAATAIPRPHISTRSTPKSPAPTVASRVASHRSATTVKDNT